MNAVEASKEIATHAVDAMKSTPLAIALLVVNVAFLAFATYVLGQVATNANERNKTQIELITKLVTDCKQGPKT